MAECKMIVCDLCGEHTENDHGMLFVRAKRRWYTWDSRGHSRESVCVCADCQRDLRKIILARRADNAAD